MKTSEKLLRTLLCLQHDVAELGSQLTMVGLEVEKISRACYETPGVIAACVVSVHEHPNAERLKCCQVEYGGQMVANVICGADNVRSGLITAWAPPGTVLTDGRRIESRSIRGVASEGMLCSEQELGFSDDADHIIEFDDDTQLGIATDSLLPVDDHLMDIAVTPNRGDCLSVLGIARELAAVNRCAPPKIEMASNATENVGEREVVLDSPACARYCGRIIEGVDAGCRTPFWIRRYLQGAGIRSNNAVVDITNYVMLELGQPLHAFDDGCLQGSIRVRKAAGGEKLVLLDGSLCEVRPDTLLITDDSGPLALAGIMGGKGSAVQTDTRRIFLECAWFVPENIAGKARQHGLDTESAYRFERGVDPGLQTLAVERATELILDICGGRAGPLVCRECLQSLPRISAVSLRRERIAVLLGTRIADEEVEDILDRLGMRLKGIRSGWEVTPPSHRFDIGIEEDLIEELARIRGYQSIPSTLPAVRMAGDGRAAESAKDRLSVMRQVLVQRGYQEVMTWSFVDPETQQAVLPDCGSLRLLNPIAPEMSVMRSSLWPGLLQAAHYNLHRQHERVRLFESGLVFDESPVVGLRQRFALGGVVCGENCNTQWGMEKRNSDFYDVKGDLEVLMGALGLHATDVLVCQAVRHPFLHPGQAAGFFQHERQIATFGRLHPSQYWNNAGSPIYLFEIQMESVDMPRPVMGFVPSRFPSMRRDLSLSVPESVPVGELFCFIRDFLGAELVEMELFDVYHGGQIGPGTKGVTFSLIFQSFSGTLQRSDIEARLAVLLSELEVAFFAKLRED